MFASVCQRGAMLNANGTLTEDMHFRSNKLSEVRLLTELFVFHFNRTKSSPSIRSVCSHKIWPGLHL